MAMASEERSPYGQWMLYGSRAAQQIVASAIAKRNTDTRTENTLSCLLVNPHFDFSNQFADH